VAKKEIAVKKYVVKLSAEERDRLEAMVRAGAVTRTEFGPAQFGSPSSGSGRGGGSPRLIRFFSEDAEGVTGCEMALDVESVVDGGLNRQKALG
jgi:hypothetical protein